MLETEPCLVKRRAGRSVAFLSSAVATWLTSKSFSEDVALLTTSSSLSTIIANITVAGCQIKTQTKTRTKQSSAKESSVVQSRAEQCLPFAMEADLFSATRRQEMRGSYTKASSMAITLS